MKTPQETAIEIVREHGYSDFPKTTSSETLFARDVAVDAIEADRAQRIEITEAQLDAAVRAVNDAGTVLYRETLRAAIEAALEVTE